MGICNGDPTASKPKEPALHAFLRSYLQLSLAVPTDGRQGPSTSERIAGRPYMSNSVPCLFEVTHGHLPPRPLDTWWLVAAKCVGVSCDPSAAVRCAMGHTSHNKRRTSPRCSCRGRRSCLPVDDVLAESGEVS